MKKKLLTSVLLSTMVLTPLMGVSTAFAEDSTSTTTTTTATAPVEESKPVIVKYVDESGTEIFQSDTFKGELASPFEIKPKEIDGYTFKEADKELKGTFTATEQVLTLTYAKKEAPIAEGKLVVNYVNEKNEVISPAETLTGKVGEEFKVKPKEIKGFTFNKVKEGNSEGSYTEADQSLTFEYKKEIKTSKVTVKYIDENEKEIKKPVSYTVKEGDKVTLDKQDITGYAFVSGDLEASYNEKEQVVFHRYKKVKQGPYIKDGRYVKISKKGYNIYSNFDWKKKTTSSQLYGQTLEARGRYEHANGNTYYSLFDNKNVWQGYINADATTNTTPEGPYISDGRIVKVKSKNYNSWSNFNWDERHPSQDIYGKTFKARGRYQHFNGNTYYSLYDSKGKWYGYINANAVGDGENQGDYISDGRYVKINKKGYSTWSNFNWKKRGSSDAIYGKTLQARGRYEHFNGDTYYSLYDVKGTWYGYINAGATTEAEPQGSYISDGRYVKVDKLGYNVYSNFKWTVRNTSDILKGNTFQARGRYEHINGNTYFTLYDNQGKWQGYIDAKAVSVITKPEGPYIKDGRYVTVNKKGYSVWSNFNWKYRNNSDELMGTTLEARGRYEHANGSTYLSLYDLSGVWQGYINADATNASKPEGDYIKDGSYVKVTKKGIDVYENFNWAKKSTSDVLFDKVYQARGKYNHVNGTTYYSLYDSKGAWYGYLESGATTKITSPQGPYISDGRYFKVTEKGFDVWQSFKEDKKNTSDNLYGKIYKAQGRYEHVNGNTYYSLYDTNGKWQGYLDAKAGQITKAEGPYIADGRYVTITSKNYKIYSNFDWKVKEESVNVYGQTFKAKGRYEHVNGNTYYSLYDNQKWVGYINSDAVRVN